jgi:hypothetical protein
MAEISSGPGSLVSVLSRWFKSGVTEIACSSKIGRIRLAISGLRNEKNKVARQMGEKVYGLLEKGELKIPEVEEFFREMRQIEKTIRVRESEIEQIIKDKEIRLLEVSGDSFPSPAAKPSAVKPKTPVSVVGKAKSTAKAETNTPPVKTASGKKAPKARAKATKKGTAKMAAVKKGAAKSVRKGVRKAAAKPKTTRKPAVKKQSSSRKKPIKSSAVGSTNTPESADSPAKKTSSK